MLYIINVPEKHLIFQQDMDKLLVKDSTREISCVIAENIQKFCMALDKRSNIHVFILYSDGKLKHIIYNDELNIDNITSVNPHYSLNSMRAVALQNEIYLFYVLNSIENKSSYICCCCSDEGKWIINRISKIDNINKASDFCIQSYNDELYLLFCKRKSIGEYKLMKYDVKEKEWVNFDGFILKDVLSIKFYINSSKEGVIYYSKNTDEGKKAYLSLKDLKALDFSWFIELPKDKKIPRVFYAEGCKYILSSNVENTIYKTESNIQRYDNKERIKLKKAIIISNRDCDMKLQQASASILTMLIQLSLITLFKSSDILNCRSIDKQSIEIKNILEEIENKDVYIKSLSGKLNEKEKLINYEYSKNKSLSQEVKLKNTRIKEFAVKLQQLEQKNRLKNRENNLLIYKYENEINCLKEEKDDLIEKLNTKLYSLFKIIEEKDELIEKMYYKGEDK